MFQETTGNLIEGPGEARNRRVTSGPEIVFVGASTAGWNAAGPLPSGEGRTLGAVSPDRVDMRRRDSGSPDRMMNPPRVDAALHEMNDRLVDFVCIRDTHQRELASGIVSLRSGALMLCPCGETVGHVWRAAVGSPRPDDRILAQTITSRGHLAQLPLRANN